MQPQAQAAEFCRECWPRYFPDGLKMAKELIFRHNGTIWGEFPYWVRVFPFQAKVIFNRLGQCSSDSKTTHCHKTQRKKYTSINIDHNYVGIHMCPGILCTSPDCLTLVSALVLSNWRGWIQFDGWREGRTVEWLVITPEPLPHHVNSHGGGGGDRLRNIFIAKTA